MLLRLLRLLRLEARKREVGEVTLLVPLLLYLPGYCGTYTTASVLGSVSDLLRL